MALQPMGPAAPRFAEGELTDQNSRRPIGGAGALYAEEAILDHAASRPVSVVGAAYGSDAFVREAASRAVAEALSTYSNHSFISLSSFRALSIAVARYVEGAFTRRSATRPIGWGYTVFVPAPPAPPPPTPDTTPPVVGNYSPAAGTPISRTTPISFDVTDDSGAFRTIFVVAFYPATGLTEVIHDGERFRGAFAATSARKAISGGFRYTVVPVTGWASAPTIQTFAIDLAGNQVN